MERLENVVKSNSTDFALEQSGELHARKHDEGDSTPSRMIIQLLVHPIWLPLLEPIQSVANVPIHCVEVLVGGRLKRAENAVPFIAPARTVMLFDGTNEVHQSGNAHRALNWATASSGMSEMIVETKTFGVVENEAQAALHAFRSVGARARANRKACHILRPTATLDADASFSHSEAMRSEQ